MSEEEIRADERGKIAERLRDAARSHEELADCFRSLGADGEARLYSARADIAYDIASIVEKSETQKSPAGAEAGGA
jgi:hypothetical protein